MDIEQQIKEVIQDYRDGNTQNFSNKQFIQFLTHQASIISQQKAEIEKLKNNLHHATLLLDKYEDMMN